MKNKEVLNLLKTCRNPIAASRTINFLAQKIFKKMFQRFTSATYFYPRTIKKVYKKCQNITNSTTTQSKLGRVTPDLTITKIKLACEYLEFDKKIPWQKDFADAEQLVSLHRWGWLLHLLLEEPRAIAVPAGMQLMQDWCAAMREDTNHPGWESYSTGERICNAIAFSHLTHTALPADVNQQLLFMVEFLSHRIEYFWAEATGNHVVNNARALYFGGQHFKKPALVQLAKKILTREIPIIINADGFMREGSSHYHFLCTRWLLELVWFAKIHHDDELITTLSTALPKMLERCWFFIVPQQTPGEYRIPLIGDVSPDFAWEWLLDLPWTQLAKQFYTPEMMLPAPNIQGWGKLFNNISSNRSVDFTHSSTTRATANFQSFPESGWYRFDRDEITVFWHAEPEGSPPFASHGHCDTGSLCFYWQGNEILIDPGRYNYNWADSFGTYGLQSNAHNNVKIDGFDPFIYQDRSRYPKFYRRNNVTISANQENDNFVFAIEHSGFSRLIGDQIAHKRVFVISKNSMMIEDNFLGSVPHQIETYFQWAAHLKIKQKAANAPQFQIASSAGDFHGEFMQLGSADDFQLLSAQTQQVIAGWHFPNYGEKTAITTLKFAATTKFPYQTTYSLNW